MKPLQKLAMVSVRTFTCAEDVNIALKSGYLHNTSELFTRVHVRLAPSQKTEAVLSVLELTHAQSADTESESHEGVFTYVKDTPVNFLPHVEESPWNVYKCFSTTCVLVKK